MSSCRPRATASALTDRAGIDRRAGVEGLGGDRVDEAAVGVYVGSCVQEHRKNVHTVRVATDVRRGGVGGVKAAFWLEVAL